LGGLNDCADKTVATWEQYWDRLTGRQEAASVTISGPTKVGPGQHIFTAVLKREYASPMAKWQWNNGNTVITTTLNTIKVGTYPVEAVTTMLNPIEVGTDPVEAMTTTLNFAEDGTYSVEVTAMDMWGHPLATGSHTVKVRSWEGSILDNKSGSTPTLRVESAIAVSVTGRPGLVVDIQSGGWAATCTTGNKPEYGPNACEFGGLRASTYTITPRGLGASVQVTVDGVGWALVQFDPVLAGPLHE
jgi:hypothetical protein